VVAETGGGPQILELVAQHAPEILLLDLDIPGVDGLDILRQLRSATTNTRVLVLTASENEEDLVEAMKLGAAGVVMKTTSTALLTQAIRKVAEGEVWLDGSVTVNVIKRLADSRAAPQRSQSGGLTPREREIAALVGQGYRYREIAEMLSISEQTVKNHLRNMFHKLGVSDRLQLALYAIHHNL